MRRPASIAALGVLLLLGSSAGCGAEEDRNPAPSAAAGEAVAQAAASGVAAPEGITVNGTGTVSVVPDRGDFTFGVETQGASAKEAIATNASIMTKVIAALEDAGLAEDDIQTLQVSLFARYSSDGQVIVGYTATNSVTARVRNLADAGTVIDAATAAGANQVYSLALVVSDPSGPYLQALEEALADARRKAEALAGAGGLSVGRITGVVESGGATPPPVPYAAEEAAVAEVPTPVRPGVQEIQANVTVTFATS